MRLVFVGRFFLPVMSVDVLFPARIDFAPSSISLTFPQTLAMNISTVAIADVADCEILDRQTFAVYQGSAEGNQKNPSVSFFLIQQRPQYTLGTTPVGTTVCVDNKSVGHLDYYSSPALEIETYPAFPFQIIDFRVFSNFGWNHRFPSLACKACNSSFNTVALKEKRPGAPSCVGRREENNPLINAVTDSDSPVDIFPFTLITSESQLDIWSFSSDRLSLSGPEASGLKEPMEICFYADRNLDNGLFLGDARFRLSEGDAGALVVFLLYLGLAFPVICLATTLLHCYRLKRHRQWMLSVKHYIQRRQLEQEMLLPQFSAQAVSFEPNENS